MSFTGLQRLAAPFVVLLCGLFASVSAAQVPAGEVPPVVEENISSIAQFEMRQTLDPVAPCDKACSDLVTDLQRPATAVKDPVPGTLTKSLFDNRFANAAKIFLPRSPVALTTATALLYGNYRVWRFGVFGAHPKDYYVKISTAATDLSQLSWEFADGSSTSRYPTYFDLPDPLPVGAVATTYSGAAIVWQEEVGGDGRCDESPLTPAPSDVEVYSWHWNACFVAYGSPNITAPVDAYGWKTSTDFFDAPTNLPSNPPYTFPFDAGVLTQEDMEDRIRTQIYGDPAYKTLTDEWCAVLGGPCRNPKDAYHTTPDCTGMTASACTQAFRDAGFTGTITTKTLDPDQAVMEVAAGRVPTTYPHEDIEIAEPRPIKVYVNPDPMPTMTMQETALADTLETQNPDTVNDTNKKTLARQCRIRVTAALRSASDCTILPIFVVGRDAVQPAENDRSAIEAHPEWVALNRRVDSLNTRWYRNQPGCLTDDRPLASSQCDEYPYWASMQAQNGPLNLATPRIAWTPAAENLLEGQALKKFYGTDSPGTFPWSGCNIEARQLTDVAPTLASTYLVIPLPETPIKTMGVCNKP